MYQAVVYGRMKEGEGRVDAPIGRNPMERKEMCVIAKNSKEAVTNYRVLQEYEGFSHLELRLETGRTHQIRVHMAYLGHPVAGDPVYGPKKAVSYTHLDVYKRQEIHITGGKQDNDFKGHCVKKF